VYDAIQRAETYLRCDGTLKLKHEFVANLPLSLSAKKNENQLILGKVTGKSFVSCFLTQGVEF